MKFFNAYFILICFFLSCQQSVPDKKYRIAFSQCCSDPWRTTMNREMEREAAFHGHTAMKRYGRPEELVGAVLWLFSDAASFVTGAEIPVDGGFSAMTI